MFTPKRALCAAVLALLFSPALHAAEVKMAFSFALPPYVIPGEGGKETSGFEYDIIKAALAVKGHTLKPVFGAMGAVAVMVKDGKADAGQRGAPDMKEGEGFYYADDMTVLYQDVAITLKKNNIALNSLADLKGHSIVAFQGASNFLGPDFGAAVKGHPRYQETSDERRRVLQLYAGGSEVYAGDINIYKFYKASATGVDTSQEVVIHKLFPNNNQPYNHAVFRDKQVRDDFNAGLKQIKANGTYKALVKKYVGD